MSTLEPRLNQYVRSSQAIASPAVDTSLRGDLYLSLAALDDGEITLDLHPEVSDLAAQATVQGGIIILTSEARTRVMVRDGETVVIGGLIRNNETEFVTGVPLFRSLPLIGRFFRSMSTTMEKRELLIVVTPRIVS